MPSSSERPGIGTITGEIECLLDYATGEPIGVGLKCGYPECTETFTLSTEDGGALALGRLLVHWAQHSIDCH